MYSNSVQIIHSKNGKNNVIRFRKITTPTDKLLPDKPTSNMEKTADLPMLLPKSYKSRSDCNLEEECLATGTEIEDVVVLNFSEKQKIQETFVDKTCFSFSKRITASSCKISRSDTFLLSITDTQNLRDISESLLKYKCTLVEKCCNVDKFQIVCTATDNEEIRLNVLGSGDTEMDNIQITSIVKSKTDVFSKANKVVDENLERDCKEQTISNDQSQDNTVASIMNYEASQFATSSKKSSDTLIRRSPKEPTTGLSKIRGNLKNACSSKIPRLESLKSTSKSEIIKIRDITQYQNKSPSNSTSSVHEIDSGIDSQSCRETQEFYAKKDSYSDAESLEALEPPAIKVASIRTQTSICNIFNGTSNRVVTTSAPSSHKSIQTDFTLSTSLKNHEAYKKSSTSSNVPRVKNVTINQKQQNNNQDGRIKDYVNPIILQSNSNARPETKTRNLCQCCYCSRTESTFATRVLDKKEAFCTAWWNQSSDHCNHVTPDDEYPNRDLGSNFVGVDRGSNRSLRGNVNATTNTNRISYEYCNRSRSDCNSKASKNDFNDSAYGFDRGKVGNTNLCNHACRVKQCQCQKNHPPIMQPPIQPPMPSRMQGTIPQTIAPLQPPLQPQIFGNLPIMPNFPNFQQCPVYPDTSFMMPNMYPMNFF